MGVLRTTDIDVQTATDAPGIPDDMDIRYWVNAALDATRRRVAGQIAVRVVDKDEMQALNREFRGKDCPTNVLAFPAGAMAGLPEEAGRVLGDLVVCAPVLHDEALAQGKPLADHWAHIVVHGTLHLLGYDHVENASAALMEALETRILAIEGIPDPYSER